MAEDRLGVSQAHKLGKEKKLKIGETIKSDSQKRDGYKYKLHLDGTCSNYKNSHQCCMK